MKHLALFGGTFSPVHYGHINVVLALQEQFKFDEFVFLPNKSPVMDKITTVSASDRLTMLRLALAPYPFFSIDERELNRSTDSYTIETLMSLHQALKDKLTRITLIIGMDSFLQFHRWRDWKKIFSLCNLIVLERPGCEMVMPEPLRAEAAKGAIRLINDPMELIGSCGGIYFFNAGAYDVSSTKIRELIAAGEDVSAFLPPKVLNYIKQKRLFGC